MWMHLQGHTDEEEMRKLFFHYLNYGNTNTYYEWDTWWTGTGRPYKVSYWSI